MCMNAATRRARQKISRHAEKLTAKEQQKLPRMSDKSIAFVKKANEYAKALPAIPPAYSDVGEFDSDLADTEKVFPVNQRLAFRQA